MTKQKIQFTLSISVWLNVTKVQTESTFLSEMGKTSQVLPDMPVLILILVMNNQEEMISRQSVMSFFTSLGAHFHGKVFQEDQRPKSMQILKRKKKKQLLKSFAETSLKSSKSLCTTAED
jgi:hypothetical protein